jgi:hypothetical protein
MEVMSLLAFLETGKPAMDLRPTNGATTPECTDLARLTVVTAEEDIIEEAIFLLTFLVHKSETLLLELKSFCSNFLFIMF